MHACVRVSPAFRPVQLAPARAPHSRIVRAKFRKELHPSYFETVESVVKMFEDSVHDPEVLRTGLADDFMCTGTEHQNIHSINKEDYINMAMEWQKGSPIKSAHAAAFAVCPYDTSVMQMAPESENELASGFVLMELLQEGAPQGAEVIQGIGRVIVNRDGQARVWERFRPLMGKEPDVLLQDPEGYRQRIAREVPRLDVKPMKGDQEKMMEIVTIIARDIFNTGSYNGDALQFLADDVVLFDMMADNPRCPATGGPTVYRGKQEIDNMARMYHELIGPQQMLAAAASEDSNTAFAHYASLVMGGSSKGWCNAAHRAMLCVTFDEACEKVTAIASARTFMAYERDTCYKPAAEFPPHHASG